MKRKGYLPLLFTLNLLFCGPSLAETNKWLEGWEYRKIIELPAVKRDHPIENVVLLDFFGRVSKKDGSDIRVFAQTGKEVPFFIVSAGPGNRYQISFPAEESRYLVYYGNPEAKKIDYNWHPQRGLLLEVYKKQGDDIRSVEGVKALIEKSKKGSLIGRGFREKIWDGTNPFGPQPDVVKIYNGYFYVGKERGFTFGTSSAGPSYLLIDEKIVASWPGWHPAEPFVRPEHTGTANLKKGLHKLTYYHIGRRYQEISVAAIKQETGGNKFNVIPNVFFLPVISPKTVKTEKINKNITAGFGWENTNYLRRERWELLTFRFFDASFSDTEISERIWSFGDGQSAEGKEVHHTYLKKGTYPVSLKIKDKKNNGDEIILQVAVEQDYSIINLPPKTYQQYIEEFQGLKHSSLGNEELFVLAELYESYNRIEDAYKVYRVLKSRNLNPDNKYRTSIISASLAEKTSDYNYAEKVYKELTEGKIVPEVTLKMGNLYLETGRLSEADAQYNKILQTKGTSEELRRKAEIGLGDIQRVNGDYAKASAIYEKFTKEKNIEERSGAYAQSVLYYLRLKDFSASLEKLLLWADEIPSVKLGGQWSILMARTFIVKKDYKKALRELEIFTGIFRDKETNPYFGWALYLIGESWEGIGDKKKASDFYKMVMEKYPGSQLYELSAKKLSSH
jgi:tetratricopeptide (TPR) repeat protein